MSKSKLFRPSARPGGHGITIGTPGLYDLLAPLFFFGRRRRAYRELLEAAGVDQGDRVLDVGCGPGYFVGMLAEAVGQEGSAIGIDAAPEMIEYANRKSRRLSNCAFQVGTVESLPFPDDSFDVVVSSLMVHHLPEEGRAEAIREMRRVLRPGGTLLVADFKIPEHGIWGFLARITGHSGHGFSPSQRGMLARVSPLEPIMLEAGFPELRTGDARPWLHFVAAEKRVARS
jgi:ubiquinone/menaquinone biosynthesis C-methylase UbiE